MKLPRLFLCFLFASALFLAPSVAFGATLYWVGGNGDSVNTNANDWSTTDPAACNDGGGDAGAVPGASDIAVFDADCDNNVVIDSAWSVAGIRFNEGYSGTGTQNNSTTLTVGSSHFVQAAGAFVGGDDAININGTFTMTGGTFTATSGTMTVGYYVNGATIFTIGNGATFIHNDGNLTFHPSMNDNVDRTFTIDVDTSLTLYDITINWTLMGGGGGKPVITAASGDTIIASNNFTITDGKLAGDWEVQGNLTIASGADGGGAGTVTFSGTSDQTYAYTASGIGSSIGINKTSGSVTPAGGTTDLDCSLFSLSSGSFTAPSGTMTVGYHVNAATALFTISSGTTFTHNDGTLTLDPSINDNVDRAFTVDVDGSLTLYNANVSATSTSGGGRIVITAAPSDTVVVSNDFVFADGKLAGAWEVQGDVTIGDVVDGGAATLTFAGTNEQSFEKDHATIPTGKVSIQKSSGTVTLSGAVSLNAAGQDLEVGTGTLNLAGYALTVNDQFTTQTGTTLQLHGDETVTTGTTTYAEGMNWIFNGDGDSATDTYTITDWATTLSGLTLASTDGTDDTFQLGANLDVNGTFTMTGGTFQQSSYQLNIAGNTIIDSDATFTKSSNSSLLILDGDLTLEVEDGTTNLGNLQIGSSPDTTTLSGNLLSDYLTIATGDSLISDGYNITTGTGGITNSGTLTLTAGNGGTTAIKTSSGVTNHGTYTAADSTLTLSGSLTNNGTFTANTSTVIMDDSAQNIGGTTAPSLYNLTLESSTTTTLTSNAATTNTITIGAGSTLNLSSYTLTATTTTITNAGTITESTGTLYHTPSSFLIADSSYSEVSSTTLGNTIYFTLNEGDQNLDGTSIETISIPLTITNGDEETVILTETSESSGIFQGSIESSDSTGGSQSNNNGTLESADSATLTITFADNDTITSTDTSSLADADTTSTTANTSGGGGGGSGTRGRGGSSIPSMNPITRRTKTDHLGNPIFMEKIVLKDNEQQPKQPKEPKEPPIHLTNAEAQRKQERLNSESPLTITTKAGNIIIFADVTRTTWYAPHIRYLAEANIIEGYKTKEGIPKGEYKPTNKTSYAEFAKMIFEASKADPSKIENPTRNESAKGTWAAPYTRLAELSGFRAFTDSLDVHKPMTRAQAISTILEAARLPIGPSPASFSDLPRDHPNSKEIATAVFYGIIRGDTDENGIPINTIRPDDLMNRAEAAKLIALFRERFR